MTDLFENLGEDLKYFAVEKEPPEGTTADALMTHVLRKLATYQPVSAFDLEPQEACRRVTKARSGRPTTPLRSRDSQAGRKAPS
jgi:hypothetical protein